jgi:hypothetical protein
MFDRSGGSRDARVSDTLPKECGGLRESGAPLRGKAPETQGCSRKYYFECMRKSEWGAPDLRRPDRSAPTLTSTISRRAPLHKYVSLDGRFGG